ncbi:Sugar-transfer associated ATP-grasp [Evansella caseinilytica]|uniref:Sugar-transfer associated ATP-grasp n=1 Tax=Evansella caseinilytica TaxID=1503961 RepID=A0A1H3HPY9_9BACI|nr:sugar-transfer associated ATP-grasp domain-containing protein [Evansella caseinilytica]SDY17547.1 Sugar-transfer associated ATP-grasp [Evansella caseinilytica]
MRKLKRVYLAVRDKYRFTKKHLLSPVRLPWKERCALWRWGFEPNKRVLYDFQKFSCSDFLSDEQMLAARFINDYQYYPLLGNKVIFERVTAAHTNVPKNYAVIQNNTVCSLDASFAGSTVADLYDFCMEKRTLVFKPISGSKGTGVTFLTAGEKALSVNNTIFTKAAFLAFAARLNGFLVTEFLHQHRYAASMYQDAVNTIRLLSMMDPLTQEPFIAAAVQRIGSAGTGKLDNFNRGALNALVDMDSGRLGKAAQFRNQKLSWHTHHPVTQAAIQDTHVPCWPMLKAEIVKLHKAVFPFLSLIGWDAVLTEKNTWYIIEANSTPAVYPVQIHLPLLTIPKVRFFYRYYQIVR